MAGKAVTVLSIVNCPVRYDSFRRGVVAVPNDRTGIITSPSCEEATRLAQYAKYSSWSPITGAPDTSDTMGQLFSQPLPLTFGRVPPEDKSSQGLKTVQYTCVRSNSWPLHSEKTVVTG
ncbi:hypothetical protein ACTXT7_000405 [Hymenolepis weldensis]